MKRSFRVGARGSALSVAQTRGALAFLAGTFPGTKYRFVPVETPGDRDLATPIEKSAPDFFTRDLDDAVRSGRIDFAVHSAKDLPDPMPEDLDWFWLPGREDPRDAWIVGSAAFDVCRPASDARPRIGVSSERRAAYARRMFPRAELLPVRGSIDSRMKQVAEGRFDAVLMAMAGINRLGGAETFGVKTLPIPVEELEPPEAQGVLAVTFLKGNRDLQELRRRFVKAVRFVSAGTGDAEYITVKGARDIETADVVLYDDLTGGAYAGPKFRSVGKRCGAHSMKQPEITRLICDEARKGRRVVRLKGGDAGLFGRLAEETEALEALGIPFVVRPGVSALTVATTGTGMLLTRRGLSRGFKVYTPRVAQGDNQTAGQSDNQAIPLVAFMATKVARAEARRLVKEGWRRTTPCAIVWDAGGSHEEIARGTLAKPPSAQDDARPGLFVVGDVVNHAWPARPRLLLTCSAAVMPRAVCVAEDLGFRPIPHTLISLVPRIPLFRSDSRPASFTSYHALVLTSPAAVRIFFENHVSDRRELPRIWTCGAGTDAEVRRYGVKSDLMPAKDFSAAGLVACIAREKLRGKRVLRLRSAKAGNAVARAVRAAGGVCDDVVLYDNVPVSHEEGLPPCEAVFFASASAVEVFLAQYGKKALHGREIFVMGEPTGLALPSSFHPRSIGDLF